MDKEKEQISEKILTAPNEFPFPFEPYSIQLDFMKALYSAIDGKKIGIFESPTGTGKSLSLICGSLTWLKDHENKQLENEDSGSQVKSSSPNRQEPLWILEFEEKKKHKVKMDAARSSSEIVSKRNRMFEKIRSGADVLENRKKYLKRKRNEDETAILMKMAKKDLDNYDNNCTNKTDLDEMEFALEDYNSEDENNQPGEDEEVFTRIYYCSRTHSQLSQFVQEVKKSPFGNPSSEFPVTLASLGSRNNLCVNEDVKKLKSVQQMNEACLEMQKKSSKKKEDDQTVKKKRRTKSKTKCEYYQNSDGISSLTNMILREVRDIEDIVTEGKMSCACPYYAARKASLLSHLVVLPYQTLLHEKTRELSGINIKDSVIIIDEAHNLVEAINQMYSCQITQGHVNYTCNQINQYAQKFNTRLKAKNLYYVKQLIFVLQQFNSAMLKSVKGQNSILTVNEFLFQSKLDNINFFKLLRYCQRSMLAKKLMGFTEHYNKPAKKQENKSTLSAFLNGMKSIEEPADNKVVIKSPLMIIESFFLAMSSSSKNGRVIMKYNENNELVLKFNLLNPAENFKIVLDEARSIIVAGGTMQPSSSLINQLVGENHRSRITEFTCGHVIEGSNQLLPIVLPKGPGEVIFDFTFENRKRVKLIDELGRLLVNLCNIVPGGIVCFFPSYNYENVVYERWKNSGLIQRLEAKKKMFREPKKSNQVYSVLQGYDNCIKTSKANPGKLNGSLLLCVVGGKMSEGINFADELGRLVVMVGMPYPNLHSPELKEKMEYLNQNMPKINGVNAGQLFYENACMKGVNQSIGRAIRHKNDYASILLLDKRYFNTKVINQLPAWISQHLIKADSFSKAFSSIKQFFDKHKTISL